MLLMPYTHGHREEIQKVSIGMPGCVIMEKGTAPQTIRSLSDILLLLRKKILLLKSINRLSSGLSTGSDSITVMDGASRKIRRNAFFISKKQLIQAVQRLCIYLPVIVLQEISFRRTLCWQKNIMSVQQKKVISKESTDWLNVIVSHGV